MIDSCEKAGYTDASMFQTYKPAQNANARNNLVNAADMILIHYRGGMANAIRKTFPHGNNPTSRHNFLATPLLHGKTTIESGGPPINPCEKHPIIAYHLSKILFETGKPVLVIGSGSGGEVVGLVRAGFNVVAVEMDHAQNAGLRARLTAEAAVLDKTKVEMELYYQQAMKDFARCQMHLDKKVIDELWPDPDDEKSDDESGDEKVEAVSDKLPEIVGNCLTCDSDFSLQKSMWCPVCRKVARHIGCMLTCQSKAHVGCCEECIAKCACKAVIAEAPTV